MRCDFCELPLNATSAPAGFLEEPQTSKHACSLSCAESFEDAIGLPEGAAWHWVSWVTHAQRLAAQREHGDEADTALD